jgi:hypothetical protein
MGSLSVVGSHQEDEFSSLGTELDRYWLEQLRRAKEICDLLERQLSAASGPSLRLVSPMPRPHTGRTPAQRQSRPQ